MMNVATPAGALCLGTETDMPLTTPRDAITQALRRFVTGDVAFLATNDILAALDAAELAIRPKEATAAMVEKAI